MVLIAGSVSTAAAHCYELVFLLSACVLAFLSWKLAVFSASFAIRRKTAPARMVGRETETQSGTVRVHFDRLPHWVKKHAGH